MANNFKIPANLFIGSNALQDAARYIAEAGVKALIVSGKNVTASGAVNKLTNILHELKIDYDIFNDIIGELTILQ